MKQEDINFFTHRFAFFKSLDAFKNSWTYSYFELMFGEMIYLPEVRLGFILVTKDNKFIDEIYYPSDTIENIAGTIIPKSLITLRRDTPNPLWLKVAEDGYAIFQTEKISNEIRNILFTEEYINSPSLPSGISYPWYQDKETPEHIQRICKNTLAQLSFGSTRLKEETDSIKYQYCSEESRSFGPYSFHMDFVENCLFMFFNYYSKNSPIIGRELCIGVRDLSKLTLNKKELCKESLLINQKKIKIEDGMTIVMNSYNPRFVHSVEKLKKENEVILLSSYVKHKYN